MDLLQNLLRAMMPHYFPIINLCKLYFCRNAYFLFLSSLGKTVYNIFALMFKIVILREEGGGICPEIFRTVKELLLIQMHKNLGE